jgi:signal transduction histidine kinase/DNA-binding response OmpR family regulator/ligand-binding sensor domain-containing protein
MLCLSVAACGQYRYESLTTSDGLSQGYIYDILQDRDGFMWFATKDGLNRYDGYTFKTYTYESSDPYSISNNTIYQLLEDSQGRIWVATDNGLNIYDRKQDHFLRIMHDPKDRNSLSGNKIELPLVELEDGRFLVAPHEKSLNLVSVSDEFPGSDTSVTIVHLPAPTNQSVEDIFKDGKGKIWLTAGENLYELVPGNMATVWRGNIDRIAQSTAHAAGGVWTNDRFFSEFVDTNSYPLFTKDVTNGHGSFFLHDEFNKRLWLGITDLYELHIFDTRNWKRGSPIDPDKTRLTSFSNVTPTKFFKDRSGIIWMGTNGYGIRKYNSGSDMFLNYAPGLSIRKILPYEKDQYYIKDWGETRRLDIHGKEWTTSFDEGLHGYKGFLIGKGNTLWIHHQRKADQADVIEHYNPTTKASVKYSIPFDLAYTLIEPKLEDSRGHIWLIGTGGKCIVLNPNTGQHTKLSLDTDLSNPMLKSAEFTSLYEDGQGTFWFGSEYGLTKLNYDHTATAPPQITWYKANAADQTALNYSHVTCILDDMLDSNQLWVATKGGGLNRLDKTTNQFIHLTTREGLRNNVVYGILTDASGNLWGSTNSGIFCLLSNTKDDSGNWQLRHFTKAAGLQDDEFNTGAYAKLANGLLAFGGVNGLNIFNPEEVLTDSVVSNIFITNLLIGNNVVQPNDEYGILKQAIEYTQSITLRNTQNFFTIEFSALDLRAPEQNKYRYQLEGIDDHWIENGNRRNVTYSHLPSGTYVFKVQGSTSLGSWSDKIAELEIKILPPWWQSWWAYLIYILAIAYVLKSYFTFRINRAKLQSELVFEHQEAKRIRELDTVKTQLYANITHEFRTPLTVILGMTNQIKENPSTHLASGLDMISRNSNNLLKLVNEMLDLSKLESGKMTLQLKNADFISFLRYNVESFQSLAATEQKQMHMLSDSDTLILAFDAEKMRQIIANLFSNALKFTPAHGNVYVSVSQEGSTAQADRKLVLSIKDTGIGIPENQLAHIFDRFYQLDNSQTRKAEGTGIGLALTKELVKLMNGTIEAKSPPVGATRGTEFIIHFPIVTIQDDDAEPVFVAPYKGHGTIAVIEEKANPAFRTHGDNSGLPLILLVEDNADVVAYTASCLEDYKIAVGKDGVEGFDIAIDAIPDLIITDVMMPYMDGFEMVDKLRRDERTSHIPIIMLTAKADIASKLEGIDKGADAYVEKPFHKEELLLRIRKLLEQRKLLQQYYSRQIGITPDGEENNKEAPESATSKHSENEFIKKIRGVVEANFSNSEFSVEKLCKLIFMSHSQLHRKLEALTDCSPNQFIRMVRLNKAKELLADPNITISSVAVESGYQDPSYFARIFKQETGMTPQEWRSRNTE